MNNKIIIWIHNPYKINKWNDIALPYNGQALLFNISKIINGIVCPCNLYREY